MFQAIKGFDILALMESTGTSLGMPNHDLRIIDCGVCSPDIEVTDDTFDTSVPEIITQTLHTFRHVDDVSEMAMLLPNAYEQIHIRGKRPSGELAV